MLGLLFPGALFGGLLVIGGVLRLLILRLFGLLLLDVLVLQAGHHRGGGHHRAVLFVLQHGLFIHQGHKGFQGDIVDTVYELELQRVCPLSFQVDPGAAYRLHGILRLFGGKSGQDQGARHYPGQSQAGHSDFHSNSPCYNLLSNCNRIVTDLIPFCKTFLSAK